jgi:membrane-associated phospholipid phosphatase
MALTIHSAMLACGALLVPSEASAQDLRYDLRVDVPVTLGGVAALGGSELLRRDLLPVHCRWCDRDATGGDTLNGLDRAARRELRWNRPAYADVLSDYTAFALTPLVAGGVDAIASIHDGRAHVLGADMLIIAESGVLAADLNQLVKFLALRERPYAHARALELPAGEKSAQLGSIDDNLSFYSGHTSETVSLAVAAGTVASLRRYRLAPAVWGSALPLALFTGYLRMGADRHYFTDVLTGAVAGALVGFLVPYLFHRPDASLSTTATGSAGPTPAASTGQSYLLGYSGIW